MASIVKACGRSAWWRRIWSRSVSDIAAVMGLDICYRDGKVATMAWRTCSAGRHHLLEMVAPTRPGTAAGRFLDKISGHGGYMVIFAATISSARQACQSDRRARRQRDHARALSRHPAASARLPRRVHRLQPHRQAATACSGLHGRGAELAETHPQGYDAGAGRNRDREPGSARLAAHWAKIIGCRWARAPTAIRS